MGKYNNSLEFYEKSLEIKRQTLGENHPDTSVTLNNIATCYFKIGECKKSRRQQKPGILSESLGNRTSAGRKSFQHIGNNQ